jgi:hypothetical protein
VTWLFIVVTLPPSGGGSTRPANCTGVTHKPGFDTCGTALLCADPDGMCIR